MLAQPVHQCVSKTASLIEERVRVRREAWVIDKANAHASLLASRVDVVDRLNGNARAFRHAELAANLFGLLDVAGNEDVHTDGL